MTVDHERFAFAYIYTVFFQCVHTKHFKLTFHREIVNCLLIKIENFDDKILDSSGLFDFYF